MKEQREDADASSSKEAYAALSKGLRISDGFGVLLWLVGLALHWHQNI